MLIYIECSNKKVLLQVLFSKKFWPQLSHLTWVHFIKCSDFITSVTLSHFAWVWHYNFEQWLKWQQSYLNIQFQRQSFSNIILEYLVKQSFETYLNRCRSKSSNFIKIVLFCAFSVEIEMDYSWMWPVRCVCLLFIRFRFQLQSTVGAYYTCYLLLHMLSVR